MSHHVFLSYSTKDKNAADAVCAALEARGIRVWIAPRDIAPGASWAGAISEAMDGALAVVLIFSSAANDSMEIERELQLALGNNLRVIPFRIEDVKPKAALAYCIGAVQWLDAFVPPMEVYYEDLSKVVGRLVAPASGVQKGADASTQPKTVFKDSFEAWCPEMVVLPPGEFALGSSDADGDAYPDEKPTHIVTIAYPFAVGQYPVTFAQFDYFCEQSGYTKPNDEGWGRDRNPVINVSWVCAKAYARWLSRKLKLPYRLPTEAEWEYACRAGTKTRFYVGNELTTKHANYGENRSKTSRVGSYPANPWLLYDMLGNIWEHVEDVWHDNYLGAPTNGSAWTVGPDLTQRVVRGGSFSYPAKDNRAAVRCKHGKKTPDIHHGFRVARAILPTRE